MSTTVKAAICHAFGAPLEIGEIRLRDPGPGELRVAVHAVAICHSDLHYIDGAWASQLPAVYGHEASGRVEALGAGVSGYALGDPVVITMIRGCMRCGYCRAGRLTLCENPGSKNGALTLPDGRAIEQGLHTGAFAESVLVHESQIAPVPEGMPLGPAALLACAGITGAGAVLNTARIEPGSDVVVIGAGGVGLNTIQTARIAGAARIIAIDLAPEKLEAAMRFGATDTLAADTPKLRRAVQALTGGRGADYVFVTVGAISVYQGAPALAARGGAVVAVGMPAAGAKMQLEPLLLAVTSQRLLGSNLGNSSIARDIPLLAEYWRQGRFKLEELISGRWRLEQINEAIADSRTGKSLRNLIVLRED